MQRYEYLVHSQEYGRSYDETALLNEKADEGWELFFVREERAAGNTVYKYYYRREIR